MQILHIKMFQLTRISPAFLSFICQLAKDVIIYLCSKKVHLDSEISKKKTTNKNPGYGLGVCVCVFVCVCVCACVCMCVHTFCITSSSRAEIVKVPAVCPSVNSTLPAVGEISPELPEIMTSQSTMTSVKEPASLWIENVAVEELLLVPGSSERKGGSKRGQERGREGARE